MFVCYFNPLSPCGERLRVGQAFSGRSPHFNPLSPCGERPDFSPNVFIKCLEFQSTLSMRRETTDNNWSTRCPDYFNPLSPCGERPDTWELHLSKIGFQSTLSMRRETRRDLVFQSIVHISIHSLHAERDPCDSHIPDWYRNFNPLSPCGERPVTKPFANWTVPDFNPLSPCGERPYGEAPDCAGDLFQSTLSMRRETLLRPFCASNRGTISIHSLHAERDRSFGRRRLFRMRFQSTLSMRRETMITTPSFRRCSISIHSLHAERDDTDIRV